MTMTAFEGSSMSDGLSKRAEENMIASQPWKSIQAVLENSWHKDTNADGM
jgi:hypothetical protein